jgi:23S rRNA pseudouridine2604 synthase
VFVRFYLKNNLYDDFKFLTNVYSKMIEKPIRLSKIMSERGICSRREAECFIDLGQVLVDGKLITVQGTKISPDADIELLSQAQQAKNNKVTVLLNKPIGIVSTQPEKGYVPAINLITAKNQITDKKDKKFQYSHLKKLSVVGRLDIDSKGLLVFTQDGVLAKKIIGIDSGIEKEYLVRFIGNVNKEILSKLSYGIHLEGQALKRAGVELMKPNLLKFILREGKKRQIRRMCDIVGLRVVGLKRVRVGKIPLGSLPEGKWRFLRENESF